MMSVYRLKVFEPMEKMIGQEDIVLPLLTQTTSKVTQQISFAYYQEESLNLENL